MAILQDSPVRSKQRIIARAVLRVERSRSGPHHAYHLLGWKRPLHQNHDPVPARRRRKPRRSYASHRERHRDIHYGVSIWMIFIGITMLDRLDLLGHFEIMDFVKRLLDGIATLIAVLTACRCTWYKEQHTQRSAENSNQLSSEHPFHASPPLRVLLHFCAADHSLFSVFCPQYCAQNGWTKHFGVRHTRYTSGMKDALNKTRTIPEH